MSTKAALYEQDFYQWTQEQAALLRKGAWHALDVTNLVEEVESLGISQKHALGSHLKNLVMHLLKWRYQPSMRQTGHSWRSTIREHRHQLARLLRDSPSLRPRVAVVLPASYAYARQSASDESGLSLQTFPEVCPWPAEQVLDADFWPEAGPRV